MRHTITMTAPLLDYIAAKGTREHPVLRQCREETAKMEGGLAVMQICPEQGAFMQQLVRLTGARKTLEVGTFTGYSALAVALALPEDGQVTACDISEEFVAKARTYWEAAGLGHKIEGHIGPAVETLDRLIAGGAAGTYDFAFIDADKTGYDAYYERALELVRRGGLVAVDNVLWSGQVADDGDTSEDTVALRKLNDKIHGDSRVEMCLVPIADGLTLAIKR